MAADAYLYDHGTHSELSNEVRFSVVLVAAGTQCHDIYILSTIASCTPNIAHYNT